MKQILFLALVILWGGCSNFNTGESFVPSQIESNLPVVYITADMDEFDEMLDKTDEEIEIKGKFNLFRDNELVIENEEVELEVKGRFSLRFSLKTLGVKFEDKYDNPVSYTHLTLPTNREV